MAGLVHGRLFDTSGKDPIDNSAMTVLYGTAEELLDKMLDLSTGDFSDVTIQPHELKYTLQQAFDTIDVEFRNQDFVYVGSCPDFVGRERKLQSQRMNLNKSSLPSAAMPTTAAAYSDDFDLFGEDDEVSTRKKVVVSKPITAVGGNSSSWNRPVSSTAPRSTLIVSADQQKAFREQNLSLAKEANKKQSLVSSKGPSAGSGPNAGSIFCFHTSHAILSCYVCSSSGRFVGISRSQAAKG